MHREIQQFVDELKTLGTPERMIWDKAYHKSIREHFGVAAPLIEKMAKKIAVSYPENELFFLSQKLWETDLFDPMILSIRILNQKQIKAGNTLWCTIVQYLDRIDGWCLEDTLAHAAWKCLLNDHTLLNEVEGWTSAPDFWKRRAALVYTLPFAKRGQNPERMLTWAASYASDPEWFIQKAIGWWLRVLGEHNSVRVLQFLDEHGDLLKGVAKREATRKLLI